MDFNWTTLLWIAGIGLLIWFMMRGCGGMKGGGGCGMGGGREPEQTDQRRGADQSGRPPRAHSEERT